MESVLSRVPRFTDRSTSRSQEIQNTVDRSVGEFIASSTDWRNLAAMAAGGMAYRMGRIGFMGSGVGAYGRTPLQVASMGLGLVAEVSAFELTNRGLASL